MWRPWVKFYLAQGLSHDSGQLTAIWYMPLRCFIYVFLFLLPCLIKAAICLVLSGDFIFLGIRTITYLHPLAFSELAGAANG